MRGLQIAAITYIIILILAILLLVPYTRRHQEKVTETNKSRIDKGGGPHPKIWLMRVPVVLNWITWAVALVFGVVYTIYLSTPSSSTYDMLYAGRIVLTATQLMAVTALSAPLRSCFPMSRTSRVWQIASFVGIGAEMVALVLVVARRPLVGAIEEGQQHQQQPMDLVADFFPPTAASIANLATIMLLIWTLWHVQSEWQGKLRETVKRIHPLLQLIPYWIWTSQTSGGDVVLIVSCQLVQLSLVVVLPSLWYYVVTWVFESRKQEGGRSGSFKRLEGGDDSQTELAQIEANNQGRKISD